MDILLYLIPIILALSVFSLSAFLWSVKNKQYEALEFVSNIIFFDDENDKIIFINA